MKNNKYLSSHIYFAISVICSVFIFFTDTNSLFKIAYDPMFPSDIGGKTSFCIFYLLISIIIYVFLLLKKRIPVYIVLSLFAAVFIFIYVFPIFSVTNANIYAASLFDFHGNFYITLKTTVEILLIIFAIIAFSVKNKYIKALLRVLAVIAPAIFIIFEFITLSSLNANDIPNLSDKVASSLFFDFLRFTPLTATVFLPTVKNH